MIHKVAAKISKESEVIMMSAMNYRIVAEYGMMTSVCDF